MEKRNLLTEQELKELLAVELQDLRSQNSKWFWIRTTIGLGYITAMVIALTIFPERILARFDIPDELLVAIKNTYIPIRIVTLITISAAYIVSYLKQWFFSYVAFAAVLVAIGNFLNDYFTFYIYTTAGADWIVYTIILARFTLIGILILNFRFAVNKEIRTR